MRQLLRSRGMYIYLEHLYIYMYMYTDMYIDIHRDRETWESFSSDDGFYNDIMVIIGVDCALLDRFR